MSIPVFELSNPNPSTFFAKRRLRSIRDSLDPEVEHRTDVESLSESEGMAIKAIEQRLARE